MAVACVIHVSSSFMYLDHGLTAHSIAHVERVRMVINRFWIVLTPIAERTFSMSLQQGAELSPWEDAYGRNIGCGLHTLVNGQIK